MQEPGRSARVKVSCGFLIVFFSLSCRQDPVFASDCDADAI